MARIYKIVDRKSWREANELGVYAGSVDDHRDGFIHLSTDAQLEGTLAAHFTGRDDLLIVAFEADDLGDALRWEQSRGGALFPHLYGTLDPDIAISSAPLQRADDGSPKLAEIF